MNKFWDLQFLVNFSINKIDMVYNLDNNKNMKLRNNNKKNETQTENTNTDNNEKNENIIIEQSIK